MTHSCPWHASLGELLRNARHGTGLCVWPAARLEYKGIWRENQRHGQGKMTLSPCSIRAGNRTHTGEGTGGGEGGISCGEGIEREKERAKERERERERERDEWVGYDGEWMRGMRHGVGTMKWDTLPASKYHGVLQRVAGCCRVL